MIIDICPRSVRFFVRSCRPQLSDAQFRHVWTIILAIAVTPRGAKLIHLAATVLDGCHRTVRFYGAIGLLDSHTIVADNTAIALPLHLLWPGFALNTLFYAAFAWLLIGGPIAHRRALRRGRGRCPACGYPVGESGRCSECGELISRPKEELT